MRTFTYFTSHFLKELNLETYNLNLRNADLEILTDFNHSLFAHFKQIFVEEPYDLNKYVQFSIIILCDYFNYNYFIL